MFSSSSISAALSSPVFVPKARTHLPEAAAGNQAYVFPWILFLSCDTVFFFMLLSLWIKSLLNVTNLIKLQLL